MPTTPAELHFVNLSKPNEGKDKETRKAIRIHIMQQYIQKKKLRETRWTTKTLSSQRCTCRRAISTSRNGSTSGPGVCPRCNGRQWTVKESAPDLSEGRQIGQQQTLVRPTNRRKRLTTGPITMLGAGRVDPFDTYPAKARPDTHELLDHCKCCWLFNLSFERLSNDTLL